MINLKLETTIQIESKTKTRMIENQNVPAIIFIDECILYYIL